MIDSAGRDIFVVDAHYSDGKRYVVRADEKLTAFLEIEEITYVADHHCQYACDY